MAESDSSLASLSRQIEIRLESLLPPALPEQRALHAAMRDSVLAPGKRIRPLMTAIVAQDLGGSSAAGIEAGCAVEMVHAASLILDDLPCMDDAEMRRGLPSLHRGHGEDVAILVSIAVLSGAYGILAALPDVASEVRTECVGLLSVAVGATGLVAGQFQDLRGGRNRRRVHEIAAANSLKTGSLFTASAAIGGTIAGADKATHAELRTFAAEIGQAFQLLDDLLDRAASPVSIGKDVGKDDNKSTIVSLLGRSSVERRIERHVETARERLEAVFGRSSRLDRLIDAVFDRKLKARMAERVAELEPREQEMGVR